MAELIKALLDALKLKPRYLIAIVIGASVLLCLEPTQLKLIGVDSFVAKYRMWLGLALIASAALLLVEAARFIWVSATSLIDTRNARKSIRLRLQNLTEGEKQILRYYYALQTRSNSLRATDGVVLGLVQARIIYQASRVGSLLDGHAFNIHPYAWELINERPDWLLGETQRYLTHKNSRWYD